MNSVKLLYEPLFIKMASIHSSVSYMLPTWTTLTSAYDMGLIIREVVGRPILPCAWDSNTAKGSSVSLHSMCSPLGGWLSGAAGKHILWETDIFLSRATFLRPSLKWGFHAFIRRSVIRVFHQQLWAPEETVSSMWNLGASSLGSSTPECMLGVTSAQRRIEVTSQPLGNFQ